MTLLGCPGIVRVLRPVTLSLEVHWEDVSELSVTATQHKEEGTLILKPTNDYIYFLLMQEFKKVQRVGIPQANSVLDPNLCVGFNLVDFGNS